jgi:arylsulfatase A-like enzyme
MRFVLIPFWLCLATVSAHAGRPNIVWVIVEDMSPNFGCYGETAIKTPNVDRLADQGVLFKRAMATAPICSIFRSAIITGMYQTSTGTHHHRSGRGKLKIRLPASVVPVPKLFQQGGYHTSNVSIDEFTRSEEELKANDKVKIAKTDYNFEWDRSIYQKNHWATRDQGRPFFCQVQLGGGKRRGRGNGERWPNYVRETLGSRTPASSVPLPPYLPDDPVIREDWAQYLDTCRNTDWEVGRIIQRLQEAGELENTVLFFFTDHCVSHVRNKQFLYDGGVHIPLVVRGPEIEAGTTRRDVVEHIDITATSLALAGIDLPEWIQGRNILGKRYTPRRYAFAARDRADETVDHMRSVRSERFKYIRNFLPQRPYLQPNRYKDGKPIIQAMRRLHAEGKLNEVQARIMAETRPPEELYDTFADPFEFNNLADDAEHVNILEAMRAELDAWMIATKDLGREPESNAMFLSDMVAFGYRPGQKPATAQQAILHRNIAQMLEWTAEGK